MKLRCGRYLLESETPLIMGIVNLTPDSFSGDGVVSDPARAIAQAQALIQAGADLIDLGAESSRPGAAPTSEEDELCRLLPVITGLQQCGVPLSVDTYKPAVMLAALAAGADMINDITGFTHPMALEVVRRSHCGLCIMHMQGEPRTMQASPRYGDVVAEVRTWLRERMTACRRAGIGDDRLVIDPGFGFGKTLAHNLELFRSLPDFADEAPVLVGVSRKSMLGALTGRPVGDRLAASITAAVMAAQRGASIVRVHDVAATRDALAIWKAIELEEVNDGT